MKILHSKWRVNVYPPPLLSKHIILLFHNSNKYAHCAAGKPTSLLETYLQQLCSVIRSVTSAGTDDILYHSTYSCAPQNASVVWCFTSTQHTSTEVLQVKTWLWIHCYSFHHSSLIFLLFIFFFISETENDLLHCINLQFNQRGVKSTQTVNLNILILWQAVSLPRGTYPNKKCQVILVAGNVRSL